MRKSKALWGCALAAALLLTACGKPNAGSSGSGSMSGSGAASQTTAAWKTGLGVVVETEDEDRTGSIRLAAAAVLLDGDGKIADVELDELETTIGADGTGAVHLPTDYRTKRQKGADYPLAEASSLKKGWAEQADAFADYLTGRTPEQVSLLKLDNDGKPTDADLLAGLHHRGGPLPRRGGQGLFQCQGAGRGQRRPGVAGRGGGEWLFGCDCHR